MVLVVSVDNGHPIVRTTVENKGLKRKRIDNAILLVGPESESPIDTYNIIVGAESRINPAKCTNDMTRQSVPNPIHGEQGRSLIPLPFYYSENIDIADEVVSYSAPIDGTRLEKEVPYSIRFFISGEHRLHRSTHDCLIINNDQ